MPRDWHRGLNFTRTKYKLLSGTTFKPHIRREFDCSIPRAILEKFNTAMLQDPVALVRIFDNKSDLENIRIKKLSTSGNSFIISTKAEKHFLKPIIQVIDIKSEKDLLNRPRAPNLLLSYLPTHTSGSTPIYSFDHASKLLVGGYGKKDLLIEDTINFDKNTLPALGLYFAEGGRTAASFTNSWPDAINCVLHFVETHLGLDRKLVKATIYCNPSLGDKRLNLEEFWAAQTGVLNFAPKLHFGKNSTSPQGTLELYFCSMVVKEIFVSLLSKLPVLNIDKVPVMSGVLSGDGSPIQQSKYSITHHVPFNKKDAINEFFIRTIFSDFTLGKVSPSKLTVYPSWEQNKFLLLNDVYKFNVMNRIKFAKRFLELPRTLREPTNKSVLNYKEKKYPQMFNALKSHQDTLVDLELMDERKAKEKLNGFALC